MLPIGVHSPGLHRRTDEQAREELWPATASCATGSAPSAAGRRRAGPSSSRRSTHGSLYVGSPETVAGKIAATARALGIARFDLKYSAGTLSHGKLMRCIELYGKQTIPLVRDLLA